MGVPLSALAARFVRLHGSRGGYREEPTIESADGISFVCPLCFLAARDSNFDPNVGVRGVHSVLCWRPRVPADVSPGPGRWDLQGTGLRDVTLVAGSSSIQLIGGCAWHGYVRSGECVDDLGPESVERARKYHAAWRQSIIDREKATMAEPTDQTQTDTAAETAEAPAVNPTVGPPGYVKTVDLRFSEGRLQQLWANGHDANLEKIWLDVPGQPLEPATPGASGEGEQTGA